MPEAACFIAQRSSYDAVYQKTRCQDRDMHLLSDSLTGALAASTAEQCCNMCTQHIHAETVVCCCVAIIHVYNCSCLLSWGPTEFCSCEFSQTKYTFHNV